MICKDMLRHRGTALSVEVISRSLTRSRSRVESTIRDVRQWRIVGHGSLIVFQHEA